MNFLTPLFLLGGLAIAGPIIYHLVRRTTRERTRFSSLMFLQPSPPRISKRQRVEHLWLLLLRCAALALLALGFARPFLSQAPIVDPTSAEPKRIVVLLDTSASMRRDGLWAAARERLDEVLRRAGPADQVAVFSFARQATPVMPFEDWNRAAPNERVSLALGRVNALSPSWFGTHLGNALITGSEALAENEDGKTAPGPRQIVLISDLQAGSRLDSLQAYEWPKGVELVVEAVKARNLTNAGVQLVAEAADSSRAVDAPVRVRVSNAAESKNERFQLGWTRPAAGAAAGDFIAPAIDAYVPPGQSRVFSVPFPTGGSAGLEQITLKGDDEGFDNTVFVIPAVQQRAAVLWIGSEAPDDARQPLLFLRRAFVETPRIAVQVTSAPPGGPIPPDAVAAASLLFVTEPVSTDTATALRAHVEAGKTLVFAPKTADAGMGAALGALLGRAPIALSEARPSNYAMFAEIDFQHPLFSPFADPRYSDFTKIQFWKYRRLDPAEIPGARVVAKFDTGDPALIETPVGRGKVYVLTSGWHREDSQLGISSKFVPLMWLLLEQSGAVANFTTQYAIGDPVPLPVDGQASTVRTPAGETLPIQRNGPAPAFAQTMQPGVYELIGGQRPQRFAVNLDANESRTAPLSADELEQLGVPIARTKTETPVSRETKTMLQGVEAENRQKLWRWFIAATLAILLVESALAGWTARRATLRTQEVTT